MHKNVVYFAHGKESGPWGIKIQRLAAVARRHGFHVESPDYSSTKDHNKRVQMLLDIDPQAEENLILVGSSMGAYVSIAVSESVRPRGLFLLAPAIFLTGYEQPYPDPYADEIVAIHGWNDAVVPVDNVIEYAKIHQIELHLVNDSHRLVNVIPKIESMFDHFLTAITG